jgi:hypothetical protein
MLEAMACGVPVATYSVEGPLDASYPTQLPIEKRSCA